MSVIKLGLRKPANCFAILSYKRGDGELKLVLLEKDGNNVVEQLTGRLDAELFERLAHELEVPGNDFLHETKELLERATNASKFVFELEMDTRRFLWRKNMDTGLKLIYGYVHLSPTENLLGDLLLSSAESIDYLRLSNESLASKLEVNSEQLERMKSTLEKHVTSEEEKNTANLTKYLALLNEKKSRILELETLISRFDCHASEFDKSSQEFSSEERRDSKSEEFHFDEDKTPGRSLPKRSRGKRPADEPVASSSKSLPVEEQMSSQDSDYNKKTQELCDAMFQ